MKPGAIWPITRSMPSARALPIVAASNTSSADSQRAVSTDWTCETMLAMRIASNMLRLSDEVVPSVPMPTLMPASRMRRTAARPEPSCRLEPGLCATDTPLAASRFMSSSSSHTACAAVKFGPKKPILSRWPTRVRPSYHAPATTAWTLLSPTWVCTPSPRSRAMSRQPSRNASVQWCGIVGAIAGRMTSRSWPQRSKIWAHAARLASAGAAVMAPTRARNSSGMASIRPGMARQNERSPIIGASTARMPASA